MSQNQTKTELHNMKKFLFLFTLLLACTLFATAQNKETTSVCDTTGLHYIADNGVEVKAYNRSITTNKKGSKVAGNTSVMLKTKLINKGDKRVKLKVFHQFLNQDEKFVGETDWAFCTIQPGDSAIVEQTANLSNIHMWTEEDPFKHIIVTRVQVQDDKAYGAIAMAVFGQFGAVGGAIGGIISSLIEGETNEKIRRNGDKYLTPILFGKKE